MSVRKGIYIDDSGSNSPEDPCYDCGSTIPLHDTALCDMAEDHSIRDLKALPGTQYWVGSKNTYLYRWDLTLEV